MHEQVTNRLRDVAQDISGRLKNCPTVARYLGPAILRRLAETDWIKSPELFTFASPMKPLKLWKPSREEAEHVQRRFDELEGLTTLEAFEFNLALDVKDVVGFKGWFQELGGASGVHFDRRLHALTSEIEAIARLVEMGKVQKLWSKNSIRPDYIADVPNFIVRLEAKAIFKRAWAVSVLQTMMRAFVELDALNETSEVMAVAINPDTPTDTLDNWIDNLQVEDLVNAVLKASEGTEVELGAFRFSKRTETATLLGLYATYVPVASLEDWEIDLAFRQPGLEAFKFAAHNAWNQCEQYPVKDVGKPILDFVWISAEATLGHPEISPIQRQITEWLECDIWPSHPLRAIGCSFPEILGGAWFVNPNLFAKESSNAP